MFFNSVKKISCDYGINLRRVINFKSQKSALSSSWHWIPSAVQQIFRDLNITLTHSAFSYK